MKDMKTFLNKLNNYSRTDLSERPNEWPDRAERIETTAKELGQALQVFNKRLSACMQSDSRYDNVKRSRKMKESKYSEAMEQVAGQFTCSYLLSHAFRSLGELARDMAEERFNYELAVDQILAYFRDVELTTLPTLAKHRKHLSRACGDLRMAREKLRHVESLRPEAAKQAEWQTKKEDCQRRVVDQEKRVTELEKVTLSHLYSFDAECHSYAANLVTLLKQLDSYHRKCLFILEEKIPLVEKDITERSFSPVFECSLMQHLEESKREVAYPIEMCVQALNTEEALREEGLFRLAGTKVKVDLLKRALNSMSDETEQIVMTCDPHSVADALKQYLRGLPEPLLKSTLYDDWTAAVKITDREARRNALQSCLIKLPQDHYINLKFLIGFLYRVSQYSAQNKMSARNLGIVLGPSLLWRKRGMMNDEVFDNDPQPEDGEMLAAVPNEVVANLIDGAPRFFPDGELMVAVSSGMSLRAAAVGGRRGSLTGRRTSVPDSPLFPVARPHLTPSLRRWPAAGSSSALYSSTRRPGTLGGPGPRWGASHGASVVTQSGSVAGAWTGEQQHRRYASMSSIDTRSTATVGEGVVLDIRQPEDFHTLRGAARMRSATPIGRDSSREGSMPRRTDMWRTGGDGSSFSKVSVEKRRFASQQQLNSSGDGGVRILTVPVSNATRTTEETRFNTTSTNFRRAGSVDAIRRDRTERTVLEVQVNPNREKENGSLRGVPVEVKITAEKDETKL